MHRRPSCVEKLFSSCFHGQGLQRNHKYHLAQLVQRANCVPCNVHNGYFVNSSLLRSWLRSQKAFRSLASTVRLPALLKVVVPCEILEEGMEGIVLKSFTCTASFTLIMLHHLITLGDPGGEHLELQQSRSGQSTSR